MLQATKLNALGGLNVRIVRLQSTENWVEWLTELRVHAMSLGIWKHVNPSVAKSDDDYLVYPVKRTWEEYKTKHIDNDPVLSQESMSTQLQFYNIANTSYDRDVHIYKERLAKEKALREWISETVKGPTFDRIQQEVNSEYENEYAPLRKLVQGIKKQYALSDLERDKKATRAELLEVADEFQAIARNNPFEKKGVVFAAWNAQSTDMSEGYDYPCQTRENSLKHRHLKQKSYPGKERYTTIRKEVAKPKWKELREQLAKKGIKLDSNNQSTGDNNSDIPSSFQANATLEVPDNFYANALLDLNVWYKEEPLHIFSAFRAFAYPLSESTIWDSGASMHLVNDKAHLDPGTFEAVDRIVESGITSDKIIGKGKRTFKGILNGRDLTISDVYVVEGFYVNIVSSTYVRNSGLWMCEEDYTVRYGLADKNVIVCKLQLINNLIFLEYKQLNIYLKAPSMLLYNVIPISQAGIVMSIPGKRRTLPWRSSRDQPNPREDTATMWHLRLGHLSKDALEKAVLHARNIKIKGIPRIECKICARTHATQVISRRKSERSAPRPF
ncbi:hypothetical protein H9Q72_014465 [Fusarium xylarioides]|uniref:GAG-pre-integrase domain-containing protein n=1 Tax=Fusarium xylarioides TaxID=221167 RepID=A0A9P7KYM3_9HYPO|nr:hypothetical protein H9Q72_014465 [Fusarium xylarioides]